MLGAYTNPEEVIKSRREVEGLNHSLGIGVGSKHLCQALTWFCHDFKANKPLSVSIQRCIADRHLYANEADPD